MNQNNDPETRTLTFFIALTTALVLQDKMLGI